MSERVWNVCFIKACDVYQPGDRAGFMKNVAEHLINIGVAVPLKGLPEANRGDKLPECDLTEDDKKRAAKQRRIQEQLEVQAERERQQAALQEKAQQGGGKHGR